MYSYNKYRQIEYLLEMAFVLMKATSGHLWSSLRFRQ